MLSLEAGHEQLRTQLARRTNDEFARLDGSSVVSESASRLAAARRA
jgi:hypothetical protein